jgi:hypothetical protein
MSILALLVAGLFPARAFADEVTDWNRIMQQVILRGGTSPLVTTRVTAMVTAAVYDAVNGIERRYTPVHADFAAPPGASRRAAAVQAAYETLVALFPSQKIDYLDGPLAMSLAAIASDTAVENSQSIARGIAWGHTVAADILAWRATDGFTPNPPAFLGGLAIGQWRPTPPGFASGAAPQFAYMTPWVIPSAPLHPHPFRPAGPPALTSDQYTHDFNETKTMGASVTTARSDDETLFARFWNGNTALYWNRIAEQMSTRYNLTLSDNARLFALLNVTMADAAIACWDAKYSYVFWRPITAIRLADTDGNPDTAVDPMWTPLLVTPPHPEYPSGHSTVSGSAVTVLKAVFGDANSFSIDSEVLPGVMRSFSSFSAALAEIHNARVFGGIHFRTACRDGSAVGEQVATYVMQNAFLPVRGTRTGQITHNHGAGTVTGDGETAVGDVM